MIRSLGIALGILAALGGRAGADDAPKPKVDFARDVRPIFADRCVSCHGEKVAKSGLRLDRKADAIAGGDSGEAIEPGQGSESLLVRYVGGAVADKLMPPKGDRLTEDQVRTLRDWIDQGAIWPDDSAEARLAGSDHWAFQPPKRPELPPVKDAGWIKNPIDAFLLARLEREGVAPSPMADRATLIRRLSLDLIGLPPTIAEADAFLNDSSDQAYEHVVDRLLASPHFGERWGRHWLDLARYADSDGYEKDTTRPFAWRYRQWVIDALNRDLAFDRFTIEQLAGDLLPDATTDQRVATGFHRNTLTNREGGVDAEEYRVAAVVDRVNTTGTTWLGLTVGCAQCHTHKYDPIKHKEYYGMFAFFNNVREVDLPAPLPSEAEAYEIARREHDKRMEPLLLARKSYEAGPGRAKLSEWLAKADVRPTVKWEVLKLEAMKAPSGATFTPDKDGAVRVEGPSPDGDSYELVAYTDLPRIAALRIEALADPKLPSKGPGRTPHGNFVLTELRVDAAPACDDGDFKKSIKFRDASSDFAQEGFPPNAAIDGDPKTGWAIAPRMGKPHEVVFEAAEDIGFPCGTKLTITIDQHYGGGHTLGKLRIAAIDAPHPIREGDYPDAIAAILALDPSERSPEQVKALTRYARRQDPEWKRLDDAAQGEAMKAPKPPATKAPAFLEEDKNRRKTQVHIRGDFLRKGDEVEPHTPAVLPPLAAVPGKEPNRLDLARWLVDPSHPLTARVAVNRTWHHLFGRPLVASADDFGTRGERPTHPELLDWLATEFIARGWSQKQVIRTIVTSNAYRQSSRTRPDLLDRDANNTWVARQSRFRPEAEVVRDLTLSASGLLNPEVGGPSVFPPQPPGISDLTYAGSAKWVESEGKDRYRRGMYTFFKRTSPYPMMIQFDAPDSNVCVVRRERSNTPLQALTLLNDAVFVECAQALARRIAAESPDPSLAGRLRYGFRVCTAREPGTVEREILTRLFDAIRDEAKANPAEAAKVVGGRVPEGSDPAEALAWVAVARALLNLDEFVTRE